MNEWQFKITDDPESTAIKVFVLRRNGNRLEYLTVGEGGWFVLHTAEEGERISPLFRFNGVIWQGDFLKGLADAIRERGVIPDSEVKVTATLEATKYHLEDLRSLVFKGHITANSHQ